MQNLEELRLKINKIDDELLRLLAERLEVVKEVGEYKKIHELPVRDEEREQSLLATLKTKGKELELSDNVIERIWSAIFQEAYQIEA